METVRQSQILDLQPGQKLEARIAEGRKGLTAIELREP
jgi:CspA family cold shock protein